MKKTVSLLVCLLLAVTLFGCVGKTPQNTVTDRTTAPDTDTGENLYDENGYLKDSIPDSLDFGRETVCIIGWKNSEALYDFSAESDGDDISKNTYSRNVQVEERLKVTLDFELNYDGGNADRLQYVSNVENTLRSGGSYDLISCYSMCAANFAMDGYANDLAVFDDIIDFTKPWWSSSLLEGSLINNKLYFASGSISATSILQTMVMSVNMATIAAHEMDDPRELAADGEWTMEVFYEMSKDAYIDTNSEIQGKDAGDTFGFISADSVMGDAFLASNGLKYLSADDSGKLVIAPEFKGQSIYELSRDLITCFKSDDYYYPSSYSFSIFTDGRSTFAGTSFLILMKTRDDMDFRYGYLPYPKANADQDEYYTASGFPYSMWLMPTYCENTERAAYVMEALASGGYRTVQPIIYNNLKYRGQNDPINATMFELIIASKTYDMGRVFCNEFEWADSPVALFRKRLYNNTSDDWYSALSGKSVAIQNVLDSINSNFGY